MSIGRTQLGNERGVVLVTALMVMALLTVVGMAALNTSDTELQISGNQRVSTQAFYLAEAGIQHAVGIYEKNGLTILKAAQNTDLSNKALGGGSYTVTVTDQTNGSLTADKFLLVSVGTSAGVTKTIEATFSKNKMVIPSPDGAFGVYGKKPVLNLPNNKKPIDGRDWDVPTNFNCSGNACDGTVTGNAPKPGLYVSDPTFVAPTQGVEGAVKIGGGVPDQDWKALASALIPYANKNPASNNLGTRTNPTITYIDNASKFNGSADGAGVLIIASTGDLKISGNFHYEGIVIVLDGGGLDSFTGTADLFGTVLMVGDNVNTEFKGGGMAKYSSKAIKNVEKLIQGTGQNNNKVKRVAWRET